MYTNIKKKVLYTLNQVFPKMFTSNHIEVNAKFDVSTITLLDPPNPINGQYLITGVENDGTFEDDAYTYVNKMHIFVDNVATEEKANYGSNIEKKITITNKVHIDTQLNDLLAIEKVKDSIKIEGKDVKSKVFLYVDSIERHIPKRDIEKEEDVNTKPDEEPEILTRWNIGFLYAISIKDIRDRFKNGYNLADDIIIPIINSGSFQYIGNSASYSKFEYLKYSDVTKENVLLLDFVFSYINDVADDTIINYQTTYTRIEKSDININI